MKQETVELIERVISMVRKQYPESRKIKVFESALAPEPLFFCPGSEFFVEVYRGKIEPEILHGSPSVALPDMEKWLRTLGVVEVEHIKKLLKIKYLPKEAVLAFAILHEMYHGMRFSECEPLEFAKYWASLNEGKHTSYEGHTKVSERLFFSRHNREEVAADEFATEMLIQHWDFLFPQFASYAAFSGTSPLTIPQMQAILPGQKIGIFGHDPDQPVDPELELARLRAERAERERIRKENSFIGRLKRKAADMADAVMEINITAKGVKTFLTGIAIGAVAGTAAAVATGLVSIVR